MSHTKYRTSSSEDSRLNEMSHEAETNALRIIQVSLENLDQLRNSLHSMRIIEYTMCETDEILQKTFALHSKLDDLLHEANTYQ